MIETFIQNLNSGLAVNPAAQIQRLMQRQQEMYLSARRRTFALTLVIESEL